MDATIIRTEADQQEIDTVLARRSLKSHIVNLEAVMNNPAITEEQAQSVWSAIGHLTELAGDDLYDDRIMARHGLK